MAFRNQLSTITKYFEESDTGKEERPKFENLEVFYNESDAYNITRVRVCYEYEEILASIKQQLSQDQLDSGNLGDTFRVTLCQDAIDAIDLLEAEIKEEIEFIHKQRSTNADNFDQNDQSDCAEDETGNNSSNSRLKLGLYNCLAQTQKREELESKVKQSSGSYYFYQLDDETH